MSGKATEQITPCTPPHTSVNEVQILAVGFYKILLVHFLLSFIVAIYVLGHTLSLKWWLQNHSGNFGVSLWLVEVGISTVVTQKSDERQLQSPCRHTMDKKYTKDIMFSFVLRHTVVVR